MGNKYINDLEGLLIGIGLIFIGAGVASGSLTDEGLDKAINKVGKFLKQNPDDFNKFLK